MKLKQFLNEKDIVGADKIYTKEEILKKIGLEKYEKLEDGTYEVGGDFRGNPKKIPVKIKIFHGDFDCSSQNLNTLKNCPEIVYGDFDCSYNKLNSLKGCPKIIYGDFHCEYNQLKSLEDGPKKVKYSFYCNNNKRKNNRKFFKKYVEFYCDVGGEIVV